MGELGERWLDSPSGSRPSPYLAPETLVAAQLAGGRRFTFFGQSGTRYFADTVMGPFTAMQTSPQKYHRFQVAEGRWYGLNARGELWQGVLSERGGRRLNLPDNLYDFAVATTGRAIAVGLPEQLWLTEGAGEPWTAVEFGPYGATTLSVDAEDRLRVTTLLPSTEAAPPGVIVDDPQHAHDLEIKLHQSPVLTPDVRALEEGRAVFTGDQWFELRPHDTGWQFARGQFDLPLRSARTQGLDDCTLVRIATRDQTVIVLCQSRELPVDDGQLSVRVADLAKLEFSRVSGAVQGRLPQVRIEAIDSHRVLATGLCVPQPESRAIQIRPVSPLTNAKKLTGCIANEPVILTIAPPASSSARLAVRPASASGAHIAALPVAVSGDGQQAAFVARTNGTSPWTLYISEDSGRKFTAHAIDSLPVTSEPAAIQAKPKHHKQRDARIVSSLNFGDDRSLSLVMRNGDTPVIYNFDDRGQLVASSLPPPAVSRVDAVGTRILAVSLTQRDVLQSMDRGASFELVGHLPSPACLGHSACPIICRTAGCLIGDRYTRVSWGSEGDTQLDIAQVALFKETTDPPPTDRITFRTPLMCRAISGLGLLGGLSRPPLATQTSMGSSLWYAPWQDYRKAAAGMYQVPRGNGRIEKSIALAPLTTGDSATTMRSSIDAGLAVNFDDAGLAVMRSRKVPNAGEAMGELEFGWRLFKRFNWEHARMRDAEAITNEDFYLLGAGKTRRLLPNMLSASEEGVFVQAHAQGHSGVRLVAPGAVTPLEPITWPLDRVRDVHWTKNNGAWQVYALDETGSVLLRATKPLATGGGAHDWTFAARTIANPHVAHLPYGERVAFAWGDHRPTVFLARATAGRHAQAVTAQSLDGSAHLLGASFDVKLPNTLAEPPPACSARDRRELNRVVLPLLPEAARAVGIEQADKPTRWLVASQAVLYVNATRACLDTMWAETLPGVTAMTSVIGLDDLKHSWLFRTERSGGTERVHAGAMSCVFDTHAKPPPETETRMQARWNLDHLPLGER